MKGDAPMDDASELEATDDASEATGATESGDKALPEAPPAPGDESLYTDPDDPEATWWEHIGRKPFQSFKPGDVFQASFDPDHQQRLIKAHVLRPTTAPKATRKRGRS